MSTTILHTVPTSSLIKNDETSLCVFDESNNLVANYDFCTGLRLLENDNVMTIYINDKDLVPGKWVLLVTEMLETTELVVNRVEGFKDGPPSSRVIIVDNPWDGCSPGSHVSWTEREERLSICSECPAFDVLTMTCTESGKPVLEVTTMQDEYCPQEFWGDKDRILQEISEHAITEGLVEMPVGPVIEVEDQSNFEEELERYLEELA